MATILTFPAVVPRVLGSKATARIAQRSADIIIFPGVRISRGTPVAASKKKRGTARRTRIEIAE